MSSPISPLEPVPEAVPRHRPLHGPLVWRRRTTLIVGFALLAAATALGAFIFVFRANDPFAVDVWWNTLLSHGRAGFLLDLSYALNWLGGGWFGILGLPAVIVIGLAIARRPWALVVFVSSEVVSAALVQVLKHTFGRARPEDILVVSDYGSFPSGHVANATTIAVALMLIFPRVWVAVAGAAWVLLMAFSRTYLGAHWLSDTLGGALVGSAAVLLVAGAVIVRLTAEASRKADDAAHGLNRMSA